MKIYYLPLGLFVALVVMFAVGLTLNPREIPSPLIGKQVPEFSLPLLDAPDKQFTNTDLKGHVSLLNVWASWCTACMEEHALLVKVKKTRNLVIYGLDYKDHIADGLSWLGRFGNPYRAVLFDPKGRTGIDLGVYGVPETFVIDKKGVIRYKYIGAITEEALEKKILPMIHELEHEPA